MNATDFKQRTGVGAESLRINHRRRFSLTSLSLPDDANANAEEGNMNLLGMETETFNCNYALIYTSGSGRHKRSSSLSSNSSSSSLSSPLWSPCNSATASQAAIPFSWEDRPGVPKQKPGDTSAARGLDLPLPPSSEQPKGVEEEARRSLLARRGIRRANKKSDDPFVTALVACTRQGMNDARVGRGRRHGSHEQGQGQHQGQGYSCMRACATVDAHIAVPRKQLMNAAAQAARPISKQHQQPPLAFIHSRAWDIELSQSLLHR